MDSTFDLKHLDITGTGPITRFDPIMHVIFTYNGPDGVKQITRPYRVDGGDLCINGSRVKLGNIDLDLAVTQIFANARLGIAQLSRSGRDSVRDELLASASEITDVGDFADHIFSGAATYFQDERTKARIQQYHQSARSF